MDIGQRAVHAIKDTHGTTYRLGSIRKLIGRYLYTDSQIRYDAFAQTLFITQKPFTAIWTAVPHIHILNIRYWVIWLEYIYYFRTETMPCYFACAIRKCLIVFDRSDVRLQYWLHSPRLGDTVCVWRWITRHWSLRNTAPSWTDHTEWRGITGCSKSRLCWDRRGQHLRWL